MTIVSPNIRLNASGAADTSVVITNAETTVNNELELTGDLVFSETGVDKFTIKKKNTGDSYVLKNEMSNMDIIFRVNQGGTDTEVMRVEGGSGALLMHEEQKLQFAVAANYISSTSGSTVNRGLNIVTAGNGDLNTTTGGDFNLTATGELDITANTVSVTAPAITKTLTSETMTSAVTKSPKLTIANSTNDAFGGVLEFNKSANESANGVLGTIQGADSDAEYAKIDLINNNILAPTGQIGSMSFSVMRGTGSYFQLMDINKDLGNTVSIGTELQPANLKVWGSLLATSTAYANDILPGTRGVQNLGSNDAAGNGLLEWGDLYLAEGGVISIGGSASILNALDVTLTQVAPAANDRGLLLNGASKVYFDDGTNYDQYIGSKTAAGGITIVTAPTSLELDGGALVDIDADGITTV